MLVLVATYYSSVLLSRVWEKKMWKKGRGTREIGSPLAGWTLQRRGKSCTQLIGWRTLALVEMDGRSCRELLEGRAHRRSLGYARDDKVEGGGAPWHWWRWMDRVKANLDKSD